MEIARWPRLPKSSRALWPADVLRWDDLRTSNTTARCRTGVFTVGQAMSDAGQPIAGVEMRACPWRYTTARTGSVAFTPLTVRIPFVLIVATGKIRFIMSQLQNYLERLS